MSVTISEVQKARRDLEKRLLIDIQQFEIDTGVVVEHIVMERVQSLSMQHQVLVNVQIHLEIPR